MTSSTRSLFTPAAALFAGIALAIAADAEPLAVGAAAPNATAKDQSGATVELKSVYAKGPTLVYFYPKSDTPGCTAQACSLRDDWSTLQQKGLQVLGVSADPVDAQKAFVEKYKLPFTILADTDGSVASAFGVGRFKRQSFLVKDNKVVWNMLERTSTKTHAADVLKALEAAK